MSWYGREACDRLALTCDHVLFTGLDLMDAAGKTWLASRRLMVLIISET